MEDKQRKKADENNMSTRFRKIFGKKTNKNEDEVNSKDVRWVQIRLLPIWLRIIIVLVLVVVVALVGAFIGYSVVGDGTSSELFKKETWTHITDIIQGVE